MIGTWVEKEWEAHRIGSTWLRPAGVIPARRSHWLIWIMSRHPTAGYWWAGEATVGGFKTMRCWFPRDRHILSMGSSTNSQLHVGCIFSIFADSFVIICSLVQLIPCRNHLLLVMMIDEYWWILMNIEEYWWILMNNYWWIILTNIDEP